MSLLVCTPDAAVADIPTNDCIERIGQVQKFGLQRTKNAGAINWIPVGDTGLLATWNALKAATDSTKVQFTPYIVGPEFEPGEKREAGGGNNSVGGVPTVIGRNFTQFSAMFEDVKQSIIKAIKSYEKETELSVFLVNEHGQVIGLVDNVDSPTQFRGIPIRSFFVSDKKIGGFEDTDKNNVSWGFVPNWSDNLAITVPSDFDALTQLS